jgi:predicted Zn-dependent peptidase
MEEGRAVSAEFHVLSNGLTVAADPLPGAESIALGLYAKVGSRSEPEQLSGLAHLVEHMVFKGAGGRDTRALSEAIEDVGGSLNAWTARDQTVFHGRALARDLPLVAELIADLVRAPHFDEEHLEREKQVILSELGECVDSPDDLVHDHLFEAAFADQPIGRSVLGTEKTVRSVARQDCFDWIEQQFMPSRLILAASGNVDLQTLLPIAERLFGDMIGHAEPSIEPAGFTGGARNDRRSFEQAHWCLAFEGLPAGDERISALSLFVQALGGGTSSRLFQELREERGLAYSIYAWNQAFADTGLVGIGCAAEQPRAAESVQLTRQILAQTADRLSGAELDRAKAQVEAGLLMGLENAQGRADHIARSIEVYGRILSLDELLGQIRSVTLEQARSEGRALLDGPVAVASVGAKLALAA